MAGHAAASALRKTIEETLAQRIPAALTPQMRVERAVVATGIAEVDAVLAGGLPVGAISELTGAVSAGRTTLALAVVSRMTHAGQVCAWVDAGDGLDPESAAGCGVELERLLWVRCRTGVSQAAGGPVQAPAVTGSRYGVDVAAGRRWGCGNHPRSEEQGLSEAVGELLQSSSAWKIRSSSGKPGTPSAVNVNLAEPEQGGRVEQVATDRLPARRGELSLKRKANGGGLAGAADELAVVAPRCAETQQGFARGRQTKVVALPVESKAAGIAVRRSAMDKKPWDSLDQAIQATDLLLQGGGFGCVVMDLSQVKAEFVSRIPLATWFRFRAAADRARTCLLVLTQHACTQSSAEVLLRVSLGVPEVGAVMVRTPLRVEVARQRFMKDAGNVVSIRKPPRRETGVEWLAPAAWARMAGGR